MLDIGHLTVLKMLSFKFVWVSLDERAKICEKNAPDVNALGTAAHTAASPNLADLIMALTIGGEDSLVVKDNLDAEEEITCVEMSHANGHRSFKIDFVSGEIFSSASGLS